MAYPTNWKRKEEESASGGKYHALDSSGNNYAGLSGMDELSQAALEAAQSSWQSANKAGDQEGMDAAHQQAESIRSKYGYSGGADGSQYLPTGSGTKQAAFSYESAPSYTSRYQNQIDELTSAILNREAFSYDPETDPLYDQYKEQYTREGQRAMQDALGEVSARTGGLASSYATTAAAQANNYYMAQLADKIPELYQLAYSMYMDEGDRLRSDLAMLQGMESGDYGRYQDRLGQYNTDRSFAYGLNRDQVADQRYARSGTTRWGGISAATSGMTGSTPTAGRTRRGRRSATQTRRRTTRPLPRARRWRREGTSPGIRPWATQTRRLQASKAPTTGRWLLRCWPGVPGGAAAAAAGTVPAGRTSRA